MARDGRSTCRATVQATRRLDRHPRSSGGPYPLNDGECEGLHDGGSQPPECPRACARARETTGHEAGELALRVQAPGTKAAGREGNPARLLVASSRPPEIGSYRATQNYDFGPAPTTPWAGPLPPGAVSPWSLLKKRRHPAIRLPPLFATDLAAEHMALRRGPVADRHERGELLPRLTGDRPITGDAPMVPTVGDVEKSPAPNKQLLTPSVPEGDSKIRIVLATIIDGPHRERPGEAIAFIVTKRKEAHCELLPAAGGQGVARFVHHVVLFLLLHGGRAFLPGVDNCDNRGRRRKRGGRCSRGCRGICLLVRGAKRMDSGDGDQ